jgi:hypothetical protein
MKKIIGLVLGLSLLAPAVALANVSITLQGGSVTVQQGQTFVEPGFTALSTNLGNVTANVFVSPVDTSVVGDTARTYIYGPDYFGDSAAAERDVVVQSVGGSMVPCSNPLAPGWNVNFPDGGCGGSATFVPFNGTSCLFNQGCMIPKN